MNKYFTVLKDNKLERVLVEEQPTNNNVFAFKTLNN